ncbi:hypothetical protein CHLRE_13g579976v5 [Chlamydomonas reinhardtii]|uniref:Uncharacterized protein n=1 Tax=Chlamydomonas reinhardtii TaxID=3055 RepID=A0A2K3D0A4_CHLRE|nr:uncharacterized protein CHLRE_13g579976v5 [Chlamydomonas reinhardtii]PNW73968.1 hypothetical protein CHLRE_13g579976v5 [Chlamydomonas reinhardtii]
MQPRERRQLADSAPGTQQQQQQQQQPASPPHQEPRLPRPPARGPEGRRAGPGQPRGRCRCRSLRPAAVTRVGS